MRTLILILCLILSIVMQPHAQQKEKPAYLIFDAKGKKVNYGTMVKQLEAADVVLFGEQHNNSLAHWLEWELLRDLTTAMPDAYALGLEMFEADDQLIVEEYLRGQIKESYFLKEAKVWDNYHTDYRPLIEWAKDRKIPVWATNVPRRYAHMVAYHGLGVLDSLPAEVKAWMAPLPITIDSELRSYRQMRDMMGGGHGQGMQAENFVAAQALKDATMAYFIVQALKQRSKLIHYHGSFHSDYHEGIAWYLRRLRPGLRLLTISCVEQEQLNKLEEAHLGKADFIIAFPASMHKSY